MGPVNRTGSRFQDDVMVAGIRYRWEKFWMQFSGLSWLGRIATRIASLYSPPYMARFYMARFGDKPFVDPAAIVHHDNLKLAPNSFLADRVIVYKAKDGGPVAIGRGTHVLRDCVLETGQGGEITVGDDTFLHPRCQVMAYLGSVRIGSHVAIAPGCAFYAYDHGFEAGELVKKQELRTNGGITVCDGAWLGTAVVVLDGVTIGEGAVIGAGAVVTADVPANCVAVGNPAKVTRKRS